MASVTQAVLLLRDAGFVARYHQVEQAFAPRFATDERNRMFAAPRDLPHGRQVLALSICAFALIASQVAYWLAVSPVDRFYFPSYPFYTGRGEGLDAVAAGYVGSSIAAVGVVVLAVALVFSWRGSVNAWPAGAAAASLAAVTAGTYLGASVGFAFDLPAFLAAIALVAGLIGGIVAAMFSLYPSARERRVAWKERERLDRQRRLQQ